MNKDTPNFGYSWPVAWTFHRNTCRWPYNANSQKASEGLQQATKEYPSAITVSLLPPELPEISLRDALSARFSCRRFANVDLPLRALSTILFAGYGVTGRSIMGPMEFEERLAPSAGGLYPLEIYLLARRTGTVTPGVYHYQSQLHILEQLRDVLVPQSLSDYLFMGQEYVTAASAVIVITGVPARSFCKYGDRGYRYMLLEAGHVAQNMNLMGCGLGFGVCNIGGFFDHELGDLLKVNHQEEIPLYAIAIGTPQPGDRQYLRAADIA